MIQFLLLIIYFEVFVCVFGRLVVNLNLNKLKQEILITLHSLISSA